MPDHPQVAIRNLFTAAGLLIFAGLMGCGKETINRIPLDGMVNHAGQPVALGTVILEADPSIGKIAPTCIAKIDNGIFSFSTKDGPVAGRYKAIVRVYDQAKMTPQQDAPPLLLNPFQVDVTFPTPENKIEFQVP